MSFRRISSAVVAVLFLLPAAASAQFSIVVDTGIPPRTIPQIIGGLVDIMHGLAFFIMTAVFLLGGLYMAASAGQESTLAKGKTLMKSSLIGMAIVTGSWMILSTFISFLIRG